LYCLSKGQSGIGKSLLFKTIIGLFQGYDGDVYIDNINIKKVNFYDLRKKIIYVGNSENLIKGSFRENLDLFGKYNDSDLTEILDDFGLKNILKSMPNGFMQELNPIQSTFSVGQIQRITILRALLCKPEILILDESLSNVDEINASNIVNYLNRNKIHTIYISHQRIPSLEKYTQIQIINGKLVNS